MRRLVLTWASLLTIGVLACGDVNAQARSAGSRELRGQVQRSSLSDNAARAKKLEELKGWLNRLAGRYLVKGTAQQQLNDRSLNSLAIVGVMECAEIGDGPGVHCLVKTTIGSTSWRTGGGRGGGAATPLVTYNTLNPAMMLFGIDPDALQIKVLLVDDHSIADVLSGPLTGNIVEFRSGWKGCWGPQNLPHCPWAFRIIAKPDSDLLRLETTWKSGGIQMEFQMRREAAGAAKVPSP